MRTKLTGLIVAAVIIFVGCKENNKGGTITPESKEDSIVRIAKINADSVFYYVNNAINLMTSKKLSAKSKQVANIMGAADPFQKKLDSLKTLLPAIRVKEIDDYRQTLLSKVQRGEQ